MTEKKKFWDVIRKSTVVLIFVIVSISAISLFASGEYFSGHTPGKDSVINVRKFTVSVNISSPVALQAESVYAEYNGAAVSTVLYKGDAATGTISFNVSAVPNGINTVKVQIKDINQNVLEDEWSFFVDTTAPTISTLRPGNNATVSVLKQVSAQIADNYEVNWDKIGRAHV